MIDTGQLIISILLLLLSGLVTALIITVKHIWNTYIERQEEKFIENKKNQESRDQRLDERNQLINKRVDIVESNVNIVETSVNKFISKIDKYNHDRTLEMDEMNMHLEMVFLKNFPDYRTYFEEKEKAKLKRRHKDE